MTRDDLKALPSFVKVNDTRWSLRLLDLQTGDIYLPCDPNLSDDVLRWLDPVYMDL